MDQIKHKVTLAYRLPPKLTELLCALYTSRIVPIEATDAVLVHRLRLEVKKRGIRIETRRRVGCWIADESLDAMTTAIEIVQQDRAGL